MGVILSMLPKKIVLPGGMVGMSNFTGAKRVNPKCACGCGNDAGCCKPPKRLRLAERRQVRLRNKVFRNFAMVDFLYTPNTPADFESATGGDFSNACCGL